MKLPVAAAAADPLTLWRRYADLLGERLAEVGTSLDVPAGVRIALPTADWQIGATGLPARPDRGTVSVDGPVAHGSHVLLRLSHARPPAAVKASVVPGRAARAAFARLCDVRHSECGDLTDVDAVAHLDDPQCDVLLALDAGEPLGTISLQTRGQTGAFFGWYVRPEGRRRRLGGTLLRHAIELAVRAQCVDVFAGVPRGGVAERVLRQCGCDPVTEYAVRVTPRIV